MAEFITMPKLGFDMREAVLSSWLKGVGEPVEKGEVIAEIESDKATLELEAQASGVLLKILEEEGAVVPIGGHLAIVGQEGEDISGMDGGEAEAEPEAEAEEAPAVETRTNGAPAAAPSRPETERAAPASGAAVSDEFPDGVKASPVARRVAREHEVDLTQIQGTGPDGRIRKADVEAYVSQREEAPAAEPAPAVAQPPAGVATEEVAASRLRQIIGRRMTESKQTIPHFYVTSEIDMAPLLALRKQINSMLPDEEKVSVNDLIVKAAAVALRDFPNLNASFGGDKIIRHQEINIGTAVAVEGGLLTVVQHNTDKSSLSKIAADHRARIGRAREGKVRPEDVEGSTFTVSNLGGFDVDHFIAIINPPNVAILAVGTAQQVPVVVDGELTIGTRMKATISADHRVTDGAEAARYMQAFKSVLEEPMRLLL